MVFTACGVFPVRRARWWNVNIPIWKWNVYVPMWNGAVFLRVRWDMYTHVDVHTEHLFHTPSRNMYRHVDMFKCIDMWTFGRVSVYTTNHRRHDDGPTTTTKRAIAHAILRDNVIMCPFGQNKSRTFGRGCTAWGELPMGGCTRMGIAHICAKHPTKTWVKHPKTTFEIWGEIRMDYDVRVW